MTCLEAAVLDCRQFREVDVSHNPLGETGLRSLLRIAAHPFSAVEQLGARMVRPEFTPQLDSMVAFNFGDLSEEYRGKKGLDLSRPYHRSILRLLLRRAGDFGMQPEAALKGFQLDGEKTTPSFPRRNDRVIIP